MKGRRIFLGDLQGCRSELESLLDKLRFDPSCDELYPVGDLVNRGPDSLGVLRLLMQLEAKPVLGNHDLHCLRVARGLRTPHPKDTLESLLRAPDCEQLLRWLGLQPFVRKWPDLWLVHAGFSPVWADPALELAGLDPMRVHASSDFATRVRYCDAQGARPASDWPPPAPPFRPWFEFWEQRSPPRRVVFGHWARLGLVDRPHAKGLDSGCVWGKQLSAWIPEEERFVSVPAERAWAPLPSPEEA